jgi:hypothetical protein
MGHSQGKPYVWRRALARMMTDVPETTWRSSCQPQQARSVPGFHNNICTNKMNNRRHNSMKIPLVYRAAGIFWARLGSLQGSTLHPVPGIPWPNAQRRDGLTHTFDKQERLTGEIRNTIAQLAVQTADGNSDRGSILRSSAPSSRRLPQNIPSTLRFPQLGPQ